MPNILRLENTHKRASRRTHGAAGREVRTALKAADLMSTGCSDAIDRMVKADDT